MGTDSDRPTDPIGRSGHNPAPFTILAWLVIVASVTAGLVAFRGDLGQGHAALVYLMVVLLVSAMHGRRTGIFFAIVCFLCFNFFLLPPYYRLTVADPLDWLVLGAFLVTCFVAAHLLDRSQRQAATARRRTGEIDRISILGAETLNAPRAEDAVEAVAKVIQAALNIGACQVHRVPASNPAESAIARVQRPDFPPSFDPPTELFSYVVEHGTAAWQGIDGGSRTFLLGGETLDDTVLAQRDARAMFLPLRVRGHMVGILALWDDTAIVLDEAQRRFIKALTFYAALGVERVNLQAEAGRADSLREADRMKDALLASLSHDLRTPLTTIKGLAHEIRGDGDDRAAVIEQEADRLNRLVTDLLDLSRLDAGGLRLEPELNAVDDLLGAALDRLAGVPRASDIDARIEGVEPIVGCFDFVHSLRALVNLIDNAIKYSPRGSRIEVVVTRRGDRIELQVLDRGRGIPAVESARIFEPFVRGEGIEPDVGGAGLGLSIALRLAEAQGGGLRYEPRPGGGSLFVLWIPAAEITMPVTTSS